MPKSSINKRREGFPGQRLVIIPPNIVDYSESQPIIRDLLITHIGAFSATAHHHVERNNGTSQFVLIGCLSGQGQCTIQDHSWDINAGDLLILPPNLRHTYGSNPKAPWSIFWVHFRGDRANDYLHQLEISPTKPLIHTHDIQLINEAFEDVYRHAKHGYNDAALMGMSTAFARLLGLAKIHQRTTGKRLLKSENRMTQTLHAIRHQPEKPWNLKEMAKLAAMSVPHFIERCRQQTGMSPNAYLTQLRLQLALEILLEGQSNVAETAQRVGYGDPFYFSRIFRKHMGIPPSEVSPENNPGIS